MKNTFVSYYLTQDCFGITVSNTTVVYFFSYINNDYDDDDDDDDDDDNNINNKNNNNNNNNNNNKCKAREIRYSTLIKHCCVQGTVCETSGCDHNRTIDLKVKVRLNTGVKCLGIYCG